MGRHKKGFNSEARKVVKGKFVDEDEIKKLEMKVGDSGGRYGRQEGDTNVLVLPAKKRRFKREKKTQEGGKVLSRRKRKLLEKVVDQKRKKAERAELLEKLQGVQLHSEVMEKMTSIAAVQTKGLKRHAAEEKWMERLERERPEGVDIKKVAEAVKAVQNPLKRRKLQALLPKKEVKSGPNVLGFDESSSGEEEEDEEEDDEKDDDDDTKEEKELSEGKEEINESTVEINKEDKVEMKKKTVPAELPSPEIPEGHVLVERSTEVQAGREKLPILGEEHTVMEAVNHHPVVILAGETGSGKTTQVPQFLFEAGYARDGKLIGVTEPRRVAAMAMARRVGHEMGLPDAVSYQVRFEGNVTEKTRIKFMTDGVLLREMSRDFTLKHYSVIVIDEAHERSVFTDILLGSLSRVVRQRARRPDLGSPLRLIVMSATLRVEDFCRVGLFRIKEEDPKPPCVKVEGREFKVTRHNVRRTPDDYLTSALKKTCQIHKDLPEGGILVFVTGQQEVNCLVRKLRKLFPSKRGSTLKDDKKEEETVEASMKKALKQLKRALGKSPSKTVLDTPEVNLSNYRVVPLDDMETDALRTAEDDEDLDQEGNGEEDLVATLGRDTIVGCQPIWCLPLYSLLSTEKQHRIFDPPPAGHRLCVVATNIAETSLTIPGIKYVVDTGKVKEKFYDHITGVSTFHVTWTSKASADQRLGRAGRQGDGHCYRLYSTEVFKNSFPDHSRPDILRRPVEDLMLQMKSMGLVKVRNFPFPTPPDADQLEAAERRLMALGALRPREVSNTARAKTAEKAFELVVTDLGRSMNAFPVAPCFGKMLALSEQHGLMPYTVLLVAALTVPELLQETDFSRGGKKEEEEDGGDEERAEALQMLCHIRRLWAGKGNSFLLGDPMLLVHAICTAESDALKCGLREFCAKYSLRYKAMVEIRKLRRQLTNEVNLLLPRLKLDLTTRLELPDNEKCLLLRQIILSGMANQVARKVIPEEENLDRKEFTLAYRCDDLEEPVFLHGKSVFAFKARKEKLPEWIVYQERFEAGGKCYLRGVTAIEPEWLPELCKAKCTFRPISGKDSEPRFDSESGRMFRRAHVTFGWPRPFVLPNRDVPYPSTGEDDITLASAHFARLFLDRSPSGACPAALAPFLDRLLCAPSTFVTMSACHQRPEVAAFLGTLAAARVCCRPTLEAALRRDPDFLREEFKGLVPRARHGEVDAAWPTLDKHE